MAKLTTELKRTVYRGLSTLGRLYWIDGRQIAYTLEDVVRAEGIKDKGRTAIPAGTYRVSVTMSTRFKREMVILYTEPDKTTLKAGGVEFSGIRMHGGNTHEDSSGCILVAKNAVSDSEIAGMAKLTSGDLQKKSLIWQTAEAEVTKLYKELIAAGNEVYLKVTNLPQGE